MHILFTLDYYSSLGIDGKDSVPWAFQAFKDERKKKPCLIAWIHSHVRGAECCFSSIDNHTQYAYSKVHNAVLGLVIEIDLNGKKGVEDFFEMSKSGKAAIETCSRKKDCITNQQHDSCSDRMFYQSAAHKVIFDDFFSVNVKNFMDKQTKENQIENDREIPADIRTSRILVEIGNGICEFIKLTVDSPSMNESGWMPLLDLQCMVKNNQILYKFFKKSMSSKYVMVQISAMPMKIKRNALVQEVIRRLRNTSRSLSWSIKAEILSEFSLSMKMSGWSVGQRNSDWRRYRVEFGDLRNSTECLMLGAGLCTDPGHTRLRREGERKLSQKHHGTGLLMPPSSSPPRRARSLR